MFTVTSQSNKPSAATMRRFAWMWLCMPLGFGLMLFLPAGTLVWHGGWLYVAVFIAFMVVAAVVLWRVNPEIYDARSRLRAGAKDWDKVLLCFLVLAMVAIFPVAAIDAVRFGWSEVPWWGVGVGYVLLLAGLIASAWAEAVNKFFEPMVRIQTDRGHTVIDTGPYAYVRHPGYVGAVLFCAGTALALGSLWALVPAAIATALFVLRTKWEDRTLQEELPGYKQYATRIRYRLLPGVW